MSKGGQRQDEVLTKEILGGHTFPIISQEGVGHIAVLSRYSVSRKRDSSSWSATTRRNSTDSRPMLAPCLPEAQDFGH